MSSMQDQPPSMAIFCPQSKAPTEDYLNRLHSYLCGNKELQPFVQAIHKLSDAWSIFATHRADIAALEQGPRYMQLLSDWITTGESSSISNAMSGILSLPLLTIIQTGQYFEYLELKGMKHIDFVEHVRNGSGLQGYCGGLLPAIAIACSATEEEVVTNASNAMRIALGIGAYGELGDDANETGPTTMVVRLKYEEQGEEIIQRFPGAHISAITDPKTVSIVGPAPTLAKIQLYAADQGLLTQAMHLRGKVHNPENIDLAKELCILCDQNECLQFPDAATIKVPIRSNKTGELLKEGSLTHEAVDTILASKCQWFQLLLGVSDDLQRTGRRNHLFVGFGIGDCVPLTPFHQAGLHITKLDVLSFLKQRATSAQASGTSYEFPSDAVAVVGMACRLPGANTVEDLWNIMSVGESRAEEVPSERIDLHQGFRALQDKKWASKQKYFGNFINKFDCFDNAFFRTNPREAVSMDPQQRLLLETAYQAMDSSGYLRTHRRESGDPVGVFIGASFVEYLENTSSNPPTAYTSTGTIRAFLCGKISYYFGWSGPSEILDTACSSSLVAIRRAVRAIQTGECPMALTGGVNIMSGLTNYLDLTKAGFLSPTGQCKPFDSGADGYCRAEGVGLVVLKPLSRALAEGDQIIGVIPGAATNQGGLSSSITVPHSPAQVRLYKDILSQAKMESHQVSYVEAHGTGTQAGDPLEVASIREVFGGSKRTSDVHLGSIKGNIGHCETAAGVAGLIKALLMVSKGSIPPLANFKSLNPKILPLEPDKLAIATKLERWEVPFRVACVNSYGAAGSNSALLVSERPPMQSQSRSKGSTKDSAYPIVLSAATKESLLAYADVLEKYLEGAANKCDLGDLAFTLAEKRQLHKYRWITTEFDLENLSLALRTGIQDRAEVVEEPKKVVLAFSGQSQRAIGLDRNLYESCPSLQIYLNKCNSFLLHEGYPTIFPAIFQTEPVLDVVALQCGMFALQYACAKSWIDSGLHVDAIIGHSFGELSALAVSGVLSMEDTLKIIATRASLMQTKWGSQPGTMLAIHSTVEVVQDLISSLSFSSISIEIACYNAHTSQVVVGTDSAVASAEKVLREESRFSGISFQRLDVTHGFHSTFTEGLLGDLDDVANSLTFKAPEIPLETCTTKQLDSVTPGRISQHTRKPVYFHQAVQRIEQRLGSCIWLEAGMNSPIIPMIKKSADASRQHLFQSLKIKDQLTPLTSLCKSTTNLWREGVSVSFWNFHHPGESGLKQIWLPPYQFQSQQHWLPYTDHALEAMKNGPITGTPELDQPSAKPSKLVTSQTETGLFSIHVVTQRFTTIVSGHAVMGRPLCPAAMYMECAVMALQLSIGDPHDQVLWFEGLSFEAPLGIDTSRDVSLTLKHDVEESGWFFTARSASKDDPKSRLTTHAKGKLGFTKKPGFQRYQRLLTDRVDELLRNPNAEILKSKRAYGLFSRIVSYSEVLKGISLITMANCEAVAEIEVSTKAETGESSATRLCDTISLDTFIQVSGLLINSSDRCSGDEAYLATGVESQSMSLSCDFEKCRSWTIYAMFTPLGDTKATGDIFVMTRDRVLVMTIMGVQFSKIPISKLEKLLDSANTKAADKSLASKSLGSQPMRVSPSQDLDSAMSSEPPPLDSDSQDSSESEDSDDSLELESLKTILASYVGLPEDQITDDANIGELGVDSLAATELADELSSKFGKDIASDDLVMSDFGALSRLLVPQKTVKKSKATPQSTPERRQTPAQSKPIEESNSTSVTASQKTSLEADAIEALAQCNSLIEASVKKLGFTEYWVKVAPKQDELTLAYMADGLRTLGVDLWKLQEGDVVPQFNYLPRHTQLVQRLWAILDRLEITASEGSQRVRLSTPVTTVPPAVLLDHLLRSFPQYGNESRLLAATGPQLANCLIGKADGVALLFGSPQSQAILGDFYNNSPMLAALTDHLLSFVGRLMSGKGKDVVRILEVGAGFGGTTTRLAETLEGSGYRVEYTFTDISSMLVKNARQKFAKYPWMDFQTLNLEKDPAPALLGKYDFVIATNVVHATSSLVNSTRRIKSLLKEDGFLVLSEVTRIVDWYDLVYGLLEGWWLANDGRDYPLVPVETWIKDLKTAGFNDVAFSHGSSEESKSQQLIVASLKHPKVQSTIGSITSELKQRCRPETVVYKIVDETEIHADIYYPSQPTSTPMPVALMFHGGGHMTLSKSAIRPAQTAFLLQNGILPISFDYRLCPEINLIDGPITDVRDALAWVQNQLPSIARAHSITVNTDEIVTIGWSTGGHLAMSTAWTSQQAGLKPPRAILSFYGPTDFESPELDRRRAEEYPERAMSLDRIRANLPTKPITSYANHTIDTTGLGWVRPGDPRSELVLSLFKEGNGLNLLLNGLSSTAPPSPERVASISPMAHLCAGTYNTPTFLIHGDRDEIVPYSLAVAFDKALRARGVPGGMCTVKGVRHIHDLYAVEGDEMWERGVAKGYEFLLDVLGK